MTEYLDQLNDAQRQAVETTEGPLLVLAGAGTGKTRVLTTRFAHILLSGKAYPNQVLAVTFTNKAASEMRERVAQLLQRPVEGLWLGNFHKICARMLRSHADLVGLNSSFTIIDTDDQLRLLKQVIQPYHFDAKSNPPQLMLGIIQSWKDKGLTPDGLGKSEKTDFAMGKMQTIYAEYQDRLRQLNTCDFGDLMLHMLEIFRKHPNVLQQYQRYFRYIMVDEYQDTNTIQYLWLRILAKKEGQVSNICCVGDDDQSIYSWRGAEIANILRFEKDFPGAQIIRLESNYRSTPIILAAASDLIAMNENRLGKTLHSEKSDIEGEKIQIVSTWDSDEEARFIGEKIESLAKEGKRYGDMAILVRNGAQTRPIEERLITLGLPYKVIGGIRFYERAEIRDAIAYMRIVAQPADNLALERIINTPRRGVGSAALQKMHVAAREMELPLSAAVIKLLENNAIKGKSAKELNQLMQTIALCKSMIEEQGHVRAVEYLLDASGYTEMWKQSSAPDAPGRLENLKELIHAIAEFQTLGGFLEHVSLIMDNDEISGDDKVNLMTLHGAKGLEFDTVFLPGWEEGLFPSQRTLDESGNAGLEEERRLAYVGLTRAKQRVIISHAANRQIYGSWQSSIPSRFIDEIPENYTDILGIQGIKKQNPLGGRVAFENYTYFQNSMKTIEGNAISSSKNNASQQSTIPIGSRVFHQKFGYGIVLSSEQNKLEIQFDKAGIKRVIDSYVTLSS